MRRPLEAWMRNVGSFMVLLAVVPYPLDLAVYGPTGEWPAVIGFSLPRSGSS